MTASNPPATYRIIDRLHIDHAAEISRLIGGLRTSPATIEPKYFYDPLGCALYAAICQLDEYYPTRTERAIFQQYRGEISALIDERGGGGTFVDLGAGDCCKAMSWLPFIRPRRYLAIDIAGPSLASALANMAPEFPEIEMIGLVTDFSQTLDIPPELLSHCSVKSDVYTAKTDGVLYMLSLSAWFFRSIMGLNLRPVLPRWFGSKRYTVAPAGPMFFCAPP